MRCLLIASASSPRFRGTLRCGATTTVYTPQECERVRMGGLAKQFSDQYNVEYWTSLDLGDAGTRLGSFSIAQDAAPLPEASFHEGLMIMANLGSARILRIP